MYKKFTLLLVASVGFAMMAFGQQIPPVHGLSGDSPEPAKKVLKVYPNPATTQVTFALNYHNEGVFEIIVYNFLGKRVEDLKNVSNSKTLELSSNYYSGIYIYQLRDQKGNLIESGKFNVIKQ